jgi:LysM repeat protein
MNSSHRHRRPRPARRPGRHAKPTQMQNVAGTAYRAAPAMAIAGTLIVGSHAHAATQVPARAAAVAGQVHVIGKVQEAGQVAGQARAAGQAGAPGAAIGQQAYTDALVIHHEQARHYTVRRGDTLSSIAKRYYGSAADWLTLYQANRSDIKNPDVIYPGEVLSVPSQPSARGTASASSSSSSSARSSVLTTSATLSGTLGCGGLEELWEQAGGSAAHAVMAASVAMAESSGRQFATGGVGERGYWQIHPDHGSLSTYNALGNAKAAVIISGNGTNWTPWTTFTSGAYRGRC